MDVLQPLVDAFVTHAYRRGRCGDAGRSGRAARVASSRARGRRAL